MYLFQVETTTESKVATPSASKSKTKQKRMPSPNALLKKIGKIRKPAKKDTGKQKVTVSGSKEEFRAAGDGASEGKITPTK